MKYICKNCCESCILEVEDDAAIPIQCPYGETQYPEWVILKEE